jgi:serine/threonine-protein kinase RsbW
MLLAPRDLPDASGPLHSLPEGGFGWFLIQNLANTLDYRRMAGENHLYLGFYDPDPTEKPT